MEWFQSGKDANKNWLGRLGSRFYKAGQRADQHSLFDPVYGDGKSNVWDDLNDGGYGWFFRPPPDELVNKLLDTPLTTRCVDRFEYDAQEFNRLAKSNYTMRGVAKKGEHIHPDFPVLVEDVFNAFHKGHPVIKHNTEIDDFGMFSKAIVEAILNDTKYDALRQTTKWNRLYSAWATRTLDKLFAKCGGGGAGRSDERGGKPIKGDCKPSEGKKDDDKKDEGEGEGGDGDEAQAQELSDDQKEQIKVAVEEFMSEAIEEVAEVEQTATKWGLESGSGARLDDGEIDELLNLLKFTPNVGDLTNMIGRVNSIMTDIESESKSITHGAPIGYVLGDELSRMAPQEFVNLAKPELRRDLERRMHEHSIQVMERESPEALGHGPMIVLLDGSQSMTDSRHMNSDKTRMTWAIAMAIMLFRRAMSTGQPYVLHKFSHKTYSFKYEQPSKQYADFLKEVMVIENGGTNIDPAMEATIESLKEFPEADVVILSDAQLSQNWYDPDYEDAKRFKTATDEARCKVIGVLINEYEKEAWHGNDGNTVLTPYENLCHAAFQINPQNAEILTEVTEGVFRQVIL